MRTWREWSWLEMLAQLDEDSMAFVVQGEDNRSRGLVGCDIAMRPGSYDHKRHHQLKLETLLIFKVKLVIVKLLLLNLQTL